MPDAKDTVEQSVPVKVNLPVPAGMPSLYAHQMIVQPVQHEIVLSFFEVMPPIAQTEEQVKAVQESGIIAECVARIMVSKAAFPNFVAALTSALKQLRDSQEKPEEANADNTRNDS